MTEAAIPARASADALTRYYFLRAGVAAVWVAAAFTIGEANVAVGGVLLVLYPAWDAVANLGDARANGGLRANRLQALNLFVSAAVAVAVAVALRFDMHLVLAVFGAWAILAGVLQLAVGVTRWRAYGAQWAMVLSGAQSALAGGFFIMKSTLPPIPSAATVAPYAALGAFYFLLSALALTWKARARRG